MVVISRILVLLLLTTETAKALSLLATKRQQQQQQQQQQQARSLSGRNLPISNLPLPLWSSSCNHKKKKKMDRRSFHSLLVGAMVTIPSCWVSLPMAARAAKPADDPKTLTFTTLDSGVRFADIIIGEDNTAVGPTSKVNVHLIGRLLGKQGWIFEHSQAAGEDPFRFDLGTGTVIPGLEQGLVGMKPGGRRRIVIPSSVGYASGQKLEPIPREFGNRQRLYTTVLNTVRIDRERQELGGENSLAGMVVFDVELLRLRK